MGFVMELGVGKFGFNVDISCHIDLDSKQGFGILKCSYVSKPRQDPAKVLHRYDAYEYAVPKVLKLALTSHAMFWELWIFSM